MMSRTTSPPFRNGNEGVEDLVGIGWRKDGPGAILPRYGQAMKIPLLLALLMPVSHAFAAAADAPTERDAPLAVAAENTHPDLVLLEEDLTRAQNERKESKLSPARYSEWETDFRSRLSEAMERIPPSPVNQAAHARVVALLGDRKEAHAALDQAIKANPDDPVLLRTKGQLLLEQKDYTRAAEHGKLAWEKSGKTDTDALALYQTAKDRGVPNGAGSPSPRPAQRRPAARRSRRPTTRIRPAGKSRGKRVGIGPRMVELSLFGTSLK